MKVAFFDLDHTLLPLDTGDAWTRLLASQLPVGSEQALKCAQDIHEGYKRGQFDIDACMQFQIGLLTKYPRQQLDNIRDQFVQTVVRPRVTSVALDLVNRAVSNGFTPVLATGTHAYIASAIAPLFGIQYVVAAQPQEDESGCFTGRLVGSHSYQEGKLKLVKALLSQFEEQGNKIEVIDAYSDSINDESLLRFASEHGTAYAVNPDDKVRALAQQAQWPIIDLFSKESI